MGLEAFLYASASARAPPSSAVMVGRPSTAHGLCVATECTDRQRAKVAALGSWRGTRGAAKEPLEAGKPLRSPVSSVCRSLLAKLLVCDQASASAFSPSARTRISHCFLGFASRYDFEKDLNVPNEPSFSSRSLELVPPATLKGSPLESYSSALVVQARQRQYHPQTHMSLRPECWCHPRR